MSKVFIVPEPHVFDKNLSSRKDYIGEIYGYLDKLTAKVTEYRNLGETCIVIFPGDVCHHGFTNMFGLLKFIGWLKTVNDLTEGNLYSVVGNHELTYGNNNPFWMACDLKSEYCTSLRYTEGFGLIKDSIKVVDELLIDDTLFIFGHYNRESFEYNYDNVRDVQLITHNTLMDVEVQKSLEEVMHRDIKAKYLKMSSLRATGVLPLTGKLSNIYLGHLHTASSRFQVQEVIDGVSMDFSLNYLGSLGRTAHDQVDDNDLDRRIYIQDTVTYEQEIFIVRLLSRAECIKEEVVQANHDAYVKTKAIADLKKSNMAMISPIEGIEEWLSSNMLNYQIFRTIYNDGKNEKIEELLAIRNEV